MVTIVIDHITILVGIILVLLAVVTPLFSPLFRFRKKASDETSDPEHEPQPVTLIIVSDGDSQQLEDNLPAFLHQHYPAGYQVIVVAQQGDHPTDDALKRVSHAYGQQPGDAKLYVTHIPDSSRYMSRKKLAVTLGVKAAEHEWIVLTEPYMRPGSEDWLLAMTAYATDDKNLVMGYSNYVPEGHAYRRYERFYMSCYLFREARRTAYRTDCPLIMFRKSEFMDNDGYLGNLNLIRGEYDFIINGYARKGGTALALNPTAWLEETGSALAKKSWLDSHVFYMETRKSLRRSLPHRLLFDVDQMVMRLFVIAFVGMAVFAGLTARWVLLAAAVVALIIEIVERYLVDRACVRRFGEHLKGIGRMDHRILWHNLYYLLRHRLADKLEFTTHKQ